MPREATLD